MIKGKDDFLAFYLRKKSQRRTLKMDGIVFAWNVVFDKSILVLCTNVRYNIKNRSRSSI